MRREFNERGLDELALSMALDLEPHDPPKGMGDRLFAKIESGSTPPTAIMPSKPSVGIWTKVASVACAVLLVLYGTALYDNHRLKQQASRPPELSKLAYMGVPLGEVVHVYHLSSPGNSAANGTAFVLRDSSGGTRVIVLGKGITKEKKSDIIQVWVKEGNKLRTAGATEPLEDGTASFAASVGKNIDGLSMTEEKTYRTTPEGKTLLASTISAQPTEGNQQVEETNGKKNKTVDVARGKNNHGHPDQFPTAIVRREEPTNEEGNNLTPEDHQGNNMGGGSGGHPSGNTSGGNNGVNSGSGNNSGGNNSSDNNNNGNNGSGNNNGSNGSNGGNNTNPPQNPPNNRNNYAVEVGVLPGVHVSALGINVDVDMPKLTETNGH